MRVSWREYSLAALLFSLLLAAVYGVTLITCYGLLDDYLHLWVVTFEQTHLFSVLSAMGRPLHAWLSEWLFRIFDSSCQLGYIRALSFLSAVLFCLLLYRTCRRSAWTALEAGSIALFICVLPAFGVYISWAVTFQIITAMALGFLAGELAFAAIITQRNRFYLVVSALLLLLSLMLYQHAAMAFWLYLAIAVFRPSDTVALSVKQVSGLITFFALVIAAYFVFYQLYLVRLIAADPINQLGETRGALVTDYLAKLIFFFKSLFLAASFGTFAGKFFITLPVLIIALSGLAIRLWRERCYTTGLLWLLLLPLSYLPSLLVAENELLIRLLGCLSALLAIYLFVGISTLLAECHLRIIRAVIFAGLAVYSIVMTQHNVATYIVELQSIERTAVVSALQEHYNARSSHIVLRVPEQSNLAVPEQTFIEYGLPSSAALTLGKVMTQQLFAETFQTHRKPVIVQCPEPQRDINCPEVQAYDHLPVIDIPQLLKTTLPGYWGL